jgi:zinc-finger
MAGSFRWFPYEGHRHAIPVQVAPGEQSETLCGIKVTRPHQPPPKYPDRLWPECPACDRHWRQAEGIAPRVNRITTGCCDRYLTVNTARFGFDSLAAVELGNAMGSTSRSPRLEPAPTSAQSTDKVGSQA